jgi:hypothetical protein
MKKFIATLVIILAGTAMSMAQTGITPGIGSTADAVHYHGAWTAGTTEYASFDAKDSTADTNGYVNSLYVGGLGRLYQSAGFTTYGGYAEYVPTKTLAWLVKSTNLPADSLRVYARGGVGETLPTVGSPFITGFGGVGASIALNTSGSIVWDTFYVEWQNPGVVVAKSGLQYYFTGSTASAQSAKAAKARRMLGLKRAHLTAEDYYRASVK